MAKKILPPVIQPAVMYRKYFKRILDFSFALIALVLLSPILIIISIFCLINFKGHIIFTQQRVGKNEQIFIIFKFITMLPETGNDKLSDKHRITKAGAFLRNSSLDELPQLFNILFGQMSWIGPRPLLVKYLPFYTLAEKQRHTVKPGITGLAQINGRNTIDWDARLKYDINYVNNIRFRTDIQIVIKTIKYVLQRKGVITDSRAVLDDLDKVRGSGSN